MQRKLLLSRIRVHRHVTQSFREWTFLHSNLPPSWARRTTAPALTDLSGVIAAYASTLSGAVHRRDSVCVLSGHGDAVEAAHLCPRHESGRYRDSLIQQYYMSRSLSRTAILIAYPTH